MRNADSPRSISSQTSASETKSIPAPPYSSGITMPSSPSSAMPSMTPMSRRWLMSFSIAFGKHALVDEAADGLLNVALLVGEIEIHGA